MFPTDLVYFARSEFKHPDLMDESFLYWLDSVRSRYGSPLTITSDYRTPEENAVASGSSPTSLHLIGRAVDVQWVPDRERRWALVAALVQTASATGAAPELELVNGPTDQHIHIGLFPTGDSPSLEVNLT